MNPPSGSTPFPKLCQLTTLLAHNSSVDAKEDPNIPNAAHVCVLHCKGLAHV